VNAQGAQWDCKCIPVNARGCIVSGDEPGCVCEEGEGRLGCGFILLYSIFYILYAIFYMPYSIS